jgi:hypothetical protein
MTEPLRIRTPKETIAGNIELLPEADLWRPIIEKADTDGFLDSTAEAVGVLNRLGLEATDYIAWIKRQRGVFTTISSLDLALIHEFWVEQQPMPDASDGLITIREDDLVTHLTTAMHAEHLDDETVDSVLATLLDIIDNLV